MQYQNHGTNNDRWIVEAIFPHESGKYFIEAGACDGIDFSSCYVLEKYCQWKGICIEPNDIYFQKLVINRPHSICENSCLSNSNEKVVYLEGELSQVHPMLGGIQSNLIKYKDNSQEIVNKGKAVVKNSITLAKLLKKYNAPQVIHYLAMDIEGSELPVLEHFPFEEYKILAISIEGNHCNDLLVAKGYVIVKNPFNKDCSYEKYFLHPTIASQRNIEISADHYISLGNNLKVSNQIDNVIELYQKAIAMEPNNYLFYFYLGNYQEEQGDLIDAIASYQKAITSNSEPPAWLYGNLANVLQKQGQFEQAISAYRKAITNYDQPPAWLYFNLGDIFQHQEKLEQVVTAYQKALSLSEQPPAWGYAKLANIWQKLGEIEKAIANYQQAIQCYSEPPTWISEKLNDILKEQAKL